MNLKCYKSVNLGSWTDAALTHLKWFGLDVNRTPRHKSGRFRRMDCAINLMGDGPWL
jgi:hypothetical protein